jgi:hypothetical protein
MSEFVTKCVTKYIYIHMAHEMGVLVEGFRNAKEAFERKLAGKTGRI